LWFNWYKHKDTGKLYDPKGYVDQYFKGKGSYVYEAYLPKVRSVFKDALASMGVEWETSNNQVLDILDLLRDRHINKKPEFLVNPGSISNTEGAVPGSIQ